MHVVELRMDCWKCYRGEQTIALGASLYGITASKSTNARASNWSGKTALLQAIRFALYGRHDGLSEDDWITRGQSSGGVGVQLSTGHTIERRRGRTASSAHWWHDVPIKAKDSATRLSVQCPDGRLLFDAPAQACIDSVVGLDADDFDATCWVGQKQASRFVTARPAERMATIRGWLQLDPLERAIKRMAQRASEAQEKERTSTATLASLEASLRSVLADYFSDVTGKESVTEIQSAMDGIVADLESAAANKRMVFDVASKRARDAAASVAVWRATQENCDRLAAVRAELADLQIDESALARVQAQQEHSTAEHKRCTLAANLAAGQHKQARALSRGEFAGVCPVDGHSCPDVARMNANTKSNRERESAARVLYDETCRAEASARLEAQKLEAEYRRLLQVRAKRDALEAECKRLASSVTSDVQAPDMAEIDACDRAAADASHVWNDASNAAQSASRARQQALGFVRARDQGVVEQRQHAKRLVLLQLGVAVLRRAVRGMAEGAVASITDDANASLSEAGVQLTVGIRWARETRDLADECSECGQPFARGKAQKTCSRCGAERGPKFSEKVEVELSNTSGAAEDIAGLTLQLAAAAWLREVRGSAWSTVIVDEPFAACDAANRKAMAAHVAALLRGRYGFAQGFVTAHHADAVDVMPQRLHVTASDVGSRVDVV